jgi:phage-related protein
VASTGYTKPLKGFGGAGVLEIATDHHGDTFRAIYTLRFEEAIYVLHVFQKKAKKGHATPKFEMNLIEQRLREAEHLARGDPS